MASTSVQASDEVQRLGAFSGVDVPTYGDILNCMHCGLCLPHCPTYSLLTLERASPRGRIALIRAIAEDELGVTEGFAQEMYRCLGCLACETACPAGVKFGELLEAARVQVEQTGYGSWLRRMVRETIFGCFLSPPKMRVLGKFLRLYQRSGLQWLARTTRWLNLLPAPLGSLEPLLPALPDRFSRETIPEVTPPVQGRRARVGVLLGCVMDLFGAAENEATVRVLARNGCEVVAPKGQKCCGALHAHAGEMEEARQLARHNIDVFAEAEVDAIVLNSAGCGAAMKAYGHWLRHDPDYADKAAEFSAKVKDLSEFLVHLPWDTTALQPVELKVTYHDACHLAHAQGITQEPRQLLRAIPGVELIELPEATWCCGSAGIYNVTHFDLSMELLARKMKNVASTGAEAVVTGNPGCLFQLQYGVRRHGLDLAVLHTVTLLDRAYGEV